VNVFNSIIDTYPLIKIMVLISVDNKNANGGVSKIPPKLRAASKYRRLNVYLDIKMTAGDLIFDASFECGNLESAEQISKCEWEIRVKTKLFIHLCCSFTAAHVLGISDLK
jgi:hypothetical protein